jgi:predicted RNA binding protein YcfA (HicA-like mRNA interferase family)
MTSGFGMMRKYMKNGWKLLRHGKEHDIFVHKDHPKEVPIPRHAKELAPGMEKGMLKVLRRTKEKSKK